jgi:hypothetical protein
MNSLVALGALSALGVSAAAAAVPALGWRTFFEEPAMLLSVVLLGRTLEERAKLQVRRASHPCLLRTLMLATLTCARAVPCIPLALAAWATTWLACAQRAATGVPSATLRCRRPQTWWRYTTCCPAALVWC